MISRPRRFWSSMRRRRLVAKLRRSRSAGLSSTGAMAQSGLLMTARAIAHRRRRGRRGPRCRRGTGGRTDRRRRRRPARRRPRELQVPLGVAGHAQAGEHLLAEPMGGGDGGGVEVGERPPEAVAAPAHVLVAAAAEVGEHGDRSGTGAELARACSAWDSRCQTRSRRVPVALRVKVTTRSSSSGRPSATSATTSDATAWVLPVPALASSTVMPSASRAVGSNSSSPVVATTGAVTNPTPPHGRGSGPTGDGPVRRTAGRRPPRRSSSGRRAPAGARVRSPPSATEPGGPELGRGGRGVTPAPFAIGEDL